MAYDAHKNLSYSLVAVPPTPALSGTALTVTTGEGTRFPAVPFNATIWPAGELPIPTNAEIVRVTAIVGTNTFTIARAQEGTASRAIITGDQIAATITVKVLTDIEDSASTALSVANATSNAVSIEREARLVADSITSLQVSVLSHAVSVMSQRFSTMAGGVAGEVLKKNTGVAYDWSWQTDLQGGGAGGASATVTSNHVSILSQAISVISQQVSALSQAHSVLSQGLSNEISNRVSAVNATQNALSQAISVISQQVSALSQAHSVLSQAHSALSVAHDVLSNVMSNSLSAGNVASDLLSNALSAVSLLSQKVSVLSQAVSVLSAAHDALSNLVSNSLSIGDVASNVLSNLVSATSLLSQKVSVMSQLFSTLRGGTVGQVLKKSAAADWNWSWQADIAGGAGSVDVTSQHFSVLSQAISVHSQKLSLILSAASVRSVGNISTHGFQSILDALSNRISAGGGAGSVTSNEASAISAQAASAINVVSNAVSIVSAQVSILSQQVSVHSQQISVLSQNVSLLSQQTSVLSNAISIISQQVSILSQRVSILFSGVSVLSTGGISTHGMQSILNALSNRISLAGVGGVSVTSNELSAASAQAASAISQLTSLHNVLSNIVSNALSAGDVASQNISVISQALSVETAARVSVVNVVSNQASIALQGISVLSQQVSVISQQISVITAALSNLTSATNAASVTLQNTISVTDRLSNVLSATGIVNPQVRTCSTVVVVSAATLTNVPSLSISCAAGAKYLLDGLVMYENATSGGFAFGCSIPPTAAAGSFIHMMMVSTVGASIQNAGLADGVALFSAAAALQTAVVSISVATINVLRAMRFDGMLRTSAAGTFQLMARTSVAGASMSIRGGFIRAYRLT